MSNNLSNLSSINMETISFIGGTYTEIPFDVKDENGNAIDISGFTYSWFMCPYGQPDTVVLYKNGVQDTSLGTLNRFKVILFSSDTVSLGGKYMQQPVLNGNPGYEYRMAQGYVEIIPATGYVTVEQASNLLEDAAYLAYETTASIIAINNNFSASFVAERAYTEAAYVNVSGDIMSGSLTTPAVSASTLHLTQIIPNTDSTTAIQLIAKSGCPVMTFDTVSNWVSIGTYPPQARFHIHTASSDKIVYISGSATGESNYGLYLDTLMTGSTVIAGIRNGISATASALNFYGINNITNIAGSLLDTYPNTYGIYAITKLPTGSSSSATNIYGGYFRIDNESTTSYITNAIGIEIDQNTYSGSITNNYGLKIGDFSKGTALNYAIYTASGLNSLGDSLTIRSGSLTITSGSILLESGGNFVTDTSLGTKFGTATTQKLGFWNATPLAQQTYSVSGCTTNVVKTGGSSISSMTEFDGWTVPKVIKTLRNLGILA